MAPVWERTAGVDGFVSLEVDPTIAYDREAQYEQAIRFHREVDRRNLYVKIPGDRAGPRRDRGLHRRGALDQRDADLLAGALRGGRRGVPARARAARRRRAAIRARCARSRASSSPASTPRPTGASTRSAAPSSRAGSRSRTRSSRTSTGRRRSRASAGRRSRQQGRRPQRCLWASTSTKNPEYRDVMYVEELIGPGRREHDARRDDSRVPGSRRGARTRSRRARRRARAARRARRRRASTTTTSSRRSSARACRSSPTRSRSCSTGSGRRREQSPRAERSRGLCDGDDAGEPARGRARAAAQAGSVRPRHLRRLGRPHAAQALPGALRAGLPPAAARAVRGRRRRAHASRRRRSSPPR